MQYSRTYWLVLLIALSAVLGFVRVVQLQIISGKEYREQADRNRLFTRYIPAPRGIFYDRHGAVLVRNVPLYKKATEKTENAAYPTFDEITTEDAIALLARDEKNIFIDQQRRYSFGPALSSVLGYTGEVTADEMKKNTNRFIGESIGKAGLEKILQDALVGTTGKEVFEMHATGKLLRSVLKENPIPGTDIHLTIDASFSAYAYELLDGRKGSVVASNPSTGEVYALVSSPSYDPHAITTALTDKNTPFLNRSISGLYPPGSTFKIITALAGLESGAITKDTTVKDEGKLDVGEFTFRNWLFTQHGRTEGEIGVVRALQRSNDIFFYKVAEWAGPGVLASFARTFHFGKSTNIELSGEVDGVVPDPEWKQRVIGEQWYLGDTYHMGIGQGDVLVTPLQLNQMTAAVANKGVWCEPHIKQETRIQCEETGVSEENLNIVLDGMRAACASGGTAFPFFDEKPVITACKTGTAEFGPADSKGRRKTHGWFTVMAPADQPTIVVTILIEGDEEKKFIEGSSDAAPIAKKLLTRWFEGK